MLIARVAVASTLLFCVSHVMAQVPDTLRHPGERHLKSVRQLTFGGENAEAYFSFDFRSLVFQSTRDSFQCDQIYTMDMTGGNVRRISNGTGRTTCAYYLPGDSSLLYSSTNLADPGCPPRPDYSRGYIWPVFKSYDIILSSVDGTMLKPLTTTEGYDAEATVSPRGDRIVFTSTREGDLELYSMNLDGSDVRRLTSEQGYDGGAFYSFDGESIVYRASHPKDTVEQNDYARLLAEGFVRPSRMEIFVMKADGSQHHQLTSFGAASFAPFFHPDGERIIFSSNRGDPQGRNFDLYMIRRDGSELEQITYSDTFDGFPMFSSDGRTLVFASNRNAKVRGETNIFIAEWAP